MTHAPQSPPAKLAAWFMRRTAPTGVRRVAPLNAAIASDVGVVRKENQDRVALVRGADRTGATFILAALADGMGGLKDGAECAALALGTFIDSVVAEAQHGLDPSDWLAHAATRANRAVWNRQAGKGGSTLVAILLVRDRRPLWLSIGDSRVYRANEAKLHQLSRDDTLEGQLGKAIEGGRRSELLQFVGIGDALEPHIEEVPVDADDTLLLTTDGVHFIEPEFLARVIHHAPDLGLCARRLTEVAKILGGPDNASVAVLGSNALQADPEMRLASTIEVWDPFGELQVMFSGEALRHHPNSLTPRTETLATAQKSPSIPSEEPESKPVPSENKPNDQTPSEGAPRQPVKDGQKKTKSGRKPRPKDRAVEARDDSPTDAPQLLIEFPNKTP
jgi:serine/threonine protein phosphatase PrpC